MSVYLDYNATTPVDEEVLEAMLPHMRESFANASSHHAAGRQARQALENAREQAAAALDAHPSEVIFTSSGTESNNAIIKGVAKMSTARTVAVGATEHPCVLCAARSLRGVWNVGFIAVDERGKLDMDDLDETLRGDCALISVMTANNETGVLQDIPSIAARVRAAGAVMHTDAAQAFGKIPLSFAKSGADAMTLSGHKFYAPKGVAALLVRREVDWAPLLDGGGHEDGRRSGTENVAGIVGFGKACELAASRVSLMGEQIRRRRDKLEDILRSAGARVFGDETERLPNTCYFGFPNIDGDAMVTMLDQSGFAVTAGAACSSMKDSPSHVLLAMEVPNDEARTAVRASLGIATTEEDALRFAQTTVELAARLRGMSALSG